MAKKNKPSSVVVDKPSLNQPSQNLGAHVLPGLTIPERLSSGFLPYLIILLGAIALYANTFRHQYALDDEIVISKNEYVLRGVAGMSDIFSKDLFDSFYKQMNTTAQLSGGRYRPLAVASFAIEQEFIGTRQDANFEADCWDFNKNGIQDASEDVNRDGNFNDKDLKSKGFGWRHVNNAIFYGLAVCMLFLFLSKVVFPKNAILSLVISLLFLCHPIHTEVVANVKSRDEIFSLLFMLLTLFMVHRYAAEKSMKLLLLTCLSFFLALLSKEYGVVLLVLIPISLYLFDEQGFQISKYVPLMGGLIAVFALYYGIRSTIVIGESNLQDAELLNNPFLLADEGQKLATKLFIFLKYFLVMLIPHPLSSDYGYNSIPYKDFGDWQVWAGILFLIACFAGLYLMLRKRHWSAFAIAFYLFTLLLVTNLIFNIGATMGERLAFHASLGFCMLVGYGLVYIGDRFNKKMLTWLLLLPILFLYSFKTHTRNRAWENDITLALTDVEIMPESTALNGNAASRNLDLSEMPKNKDREKELIRNAIGYAKKSVQLHDRFVNGYLNLGLGYAKLEQYDSAKVVWDKAFQIYPSHPSKSLYYNLLADAYYRKGFAFGAEKNWTEGKRFLEKAIEVSPDNARYWYDLGGFAYNAADYASAKAAWDKAFQLAPNDTLIQRVQQVFK